MNLQWIFKNEEHEGRSTAITLLLLNPINEIVYRSQLNFRSKKHEVHMIEVNKVALNRNNDKRIAKKDGISTLAHGHNLYAGTPYSGR